MVRSGGNRVVDTRGIWRFFNRSRIFVKKSARVAVRALPGGEECAGFGADLSFSPKGHVFHPRGYRLMAVNAVRPVPAAVGLVELANWHGPGGNKTLKLLFL